ncbi:Y-family DNA polymerase [Niveispirillum lacus]|nr:DNA polymerase Y family protein [Niveispirillum lacus]
MSGPLALTLAGQGGIRLYAVDALATADGLRPGMLLADARALSPDLIAMPANPAADRAALARLAIWAQRYTPQAATDGTDGLILDITGCTHLLGGEERLLTDLADRLGRAGLTCRLAVGDTGAAAWGWARHRSATAGPVLPTGTRSWVSLLSLPLAALRLDEGVCKDLARVGLRSVGDLQRQPRAPLAARFGTGPLRRLDRMLGVAADPVVPEMATPGWQVHRAFADPIMTRDAIETALLMLLRDLSIRLEAAGRGVRRLRLTCLRTDTTAQNISIGTARPVRDPQGLLNLFRERFDKIDPGFGIEMMELTATGTDSFTGEQAGLAVGGGDAFAVMGLLDRLVNRLGEDQVGHPLPRDTHRPEQVMELVREVEGKTDTGTLCSPTLRKLPACRTAADATTPTSPWPKPQPTRPLPARPRTWAMEGPRPLLLLHPPEPVQVGSGLSWRGHYLPIDWLEGPERIRPDWWRARIGPTRDYYRAQLADGRRLWLFRTVDDRGAWYLHGLCA